MYERVLRISVRIIWPPILAVLSWLAGRSAVQLTPAERAAGLRVRPAAPYRRSSNRRRRAQWRRPPLSPSEAVSPGIVPPRQIIVAGPRWHTKAPVLPTSARDVCSKYAHTYYHIILISILLCNTKFGRIRQLKIPIISVSVYTSIQRYTALQYTFIYYH